MRTVDSKNNLSDSLVVAVAIKISRSPRKIWNPITIDQNPQIGYIMAYSE